MMMDVLLLLLTVIEIRWQKWIVITFPVLTAAAAAARQ